MTIHQILSLFQGVHTSYAEDNNISGVCTLIVQSERPNMDFSKIYFSENICGTVTDLKGFLEARRFDDPLSFTVQCCDKDQAQDIIDALPENTDQLDPRLAVLTDFSVVRPYKHTHRIINRGVWQ